MKTSQNLEQEIQLLKERNKRVETDKAWETSLFRKAVIAMLTYFVIVLFFCFASLPKPFVNAIVPTIGFLLSTLSVQIFKDFWIHFYYKK